MAKVEDTTSVASREAKLKKMGSEAAAKALKFVGKQKLGHAKAQFLKQFLSTCLYAASIVGTILLFNMATEVQPWASTTIPARADGAPMQIKFKLKDCQMDFEAGPEPGIHQYRTTVDRSKPGEIMWSGTPEDELLLVCSGPANDVGDDESILVHVGPDVILDAVDISFEGDGGIARVAELDIRSRLRARGVYGIVQLNHITGLEELEIQLDLGYIGLVETKFDHSSLVLGESVDIYWFQRVFTPDVPGLQVYVETTQGQNSSAGLCVSDNTTRPILVEAGPAETEFDHQFTLGNPPYKWMEITRKNGRNRMVFSHGVWISDRNCNNTFDTFGTESFSDPPTLGRAFRSWARQAYSQGLELINIWLVGSSLGLDAQGHETSGMWIFSTTGDGLIWFPMQVWKVFTLGIMEPRVQRRIGIVRDQTCLSNYAKLVQGKPTCRPDIITEGAVISNIKKVSSSAIREALPEGWNLTNAPNSRIYQVHDLDVTRGWPSLADGSVSILATKTGAFVKYVVDKRDYYHGFVGFLFVTAMIFLPIVGGVFLCILLHMLYKMEKGRYLRARGTAKSKKGAGRSQSKKSVYAERFSEDVAEEVEKYLEMEAKSNLLLTLVRCLILKSPAGGKELTLKELLEMIAGHFLVMQLLISPFVLLSILIVDNKGSLRVLCAHNVWVHGTCVNDSMIGWSNFLMVLAVTFNAIFFLNATMEYSTRYALDMLESTGTAPKFNLYLWHIRSSKLYSLSVSCIQCLTLFIFCAYFILVFLFILLGTLLRPSTLGPVLLSISGAAIVGQQITVKFNEIVEKAKQFAMDMLKQAESYMKEGEAVVKGLGTDLLSKIPGGEKVSDLLEKMPNVEDLMEKGKEHMTQVFDKMGNLEDLQRLLQGAVQGVAAANVAPIVEMLESLAAKNSAAAAQMLQAALSNHPQSGMQMIQTLAARNPTMAAQIMNRLQKNELLAPLMEKLPPEIADQLKDSGTSLPASVETPAAGVADGDMSDVVQNLQELAAGNPDAASQMFHAVVASNPDSGSQMMQSMSQLNPATAMVMLKSFATGNPTSAISLLDSLPPEAKEQLQGILKDAGLPISMEDLAAAKAMIEDVYNGKMDPMAALKGVAFKGAEAAQEHLNVDMGETDDLGGHSAVADALHKVAGKVDYEGAKAEADAEEGAVEDVEENILMTLGLSKGQLILLNIQAVLLFLSWVGFMLLGAYLFLGSDALIPQLTANASAVGSAVTLIRSKSSELRSGDLKAIQSTMESANEELKGQAAKKND